MGQTIFDKLWDRHVITGEVGEPQLLYVDFHMIHEVTSPQAFQGLRESGRKVRRPDLTFGTTDHNVPTVDIFNISDLISKNQIDTLARNVQEFGIDAATHGSDRQGIVHMVGPKQAMRSRVKLSFVAILTRQQMAHLVPLLLGLGRARLNTFLRRKPYGK